MAKYTTVYKIKNHFDYTGLQNFGWICHLFVFGRITTNFLSMNPNTKSVFSHPLWISHSCQFCIFSGKILYLNIFETYSFVIWKQNKILSSLQKKKSWKSDKSFPKYRTGKTIEIFRMKKHLNESFFFYIWHFYIGFFDIFADYRIL